MGVLGLALALLAGVPVFASEPSERSEGAKEESMAVFQLAYAAAMPKVGSSQSPMIAWVPRFADVWKGWDLRAVVGVSWYEASLGGRFLALTTQALAERSVSSGSGAEGLCRAGVGPGVQSWISNGGAFLTAGARMSCGDSRFVLAGYQRVFVPSNGVNELTVGVGARF